MAGRDDLAALREQTTLASSAAVSVSDLDLAYQLQLAEAIQASLSLDALSSNPSSSKGKAPIAAAAASSSSSRSQPAPPEPSDASYALAVHATDLARAEEDHRYAEACRAYHARAAASASVAAHDAIFARELAAVPEDQWAHDGDNIERPLDSTKPLFHVMFKGMASKEVVGSRDWDPRVAVLAVALCDSQGKVVLSIQKPVEGFVGGRMMLEAMALTEGLQAALGLGIQSIGIVNDYKALHNHVCHDATSKSLCIYHLFYYCLVSGDLLPAQPRRHPDRGRRVNATSPMAVGRALEGLLSVPVHSLRVTAHHPEHFLVLFTQPAHQVNALRRGSIRVEGASFNIASWHEHDHAIFGSLHLHVRVVIEMVPMQFWSV
ncbi:putative E3 ubiquitin-protein ligase rbrA [Hordeum vulgare]|nr:putative E3 ubiquitin-protein ligase rbrA [Hordeum vulgare]